MHSLDPTFPLFPIFSCLGFVLGLVPLPWHLQAWNAGTCAYMLWTSISCLIEFINSLVWSGNVSNPAPVWCDISTKFLLGAGVGITASALCISRRLYNIASVQTVSISRQDKQRAVIEDLAIAGGIPVLVMILHYVVQPHRFDILEDIGCYAAIYNTLPAYFLVFMWPVVLGSISFVYSALTLRAFWKRRIQFKEIVSSSSSMNVSRYLRLMLLACTDMMFSVPLGVYSIYIGNKGVALAPWISWENVHLDFSRVDLVPTAVWRSDPSFRTSVELTRWLYPASAMIFFILFGFALEAQKHYRLAFWWIAKPLGFHPSPTKQSHGSKSGPHPYNKKPQGPPMSAGPPPAYIPSSPFRKHRIESLSSSVTSTDANMDIDVEKTAGFSSPTSSVPPVYSDERSSIHSHTEAFPMTPIPSLPFNSRDHILIPDTATAA